MRPYARARKPPPLPPQPDPVTGFLPNSRKGTIQPNDQIDVFDWAPFRVWTTTETNGFNIAPRYLRDWFYYVPEMMTIAPEEGQDEKPFIPEKAKVLGDPKINKEFILAGNFEGVPEETRALYTALHNIAKDRPNATPHVRKFSEEVYKFCDFPADFKMETNKPVDMTLGRSLIKGGDIDRIVFNGKGHVVLGMHEGVFDPTVLGYLDYGHHAIMGYSLAVNVNNFVNFPPEGEFQEEQEQEVFFWNVKNHKISLLRIQCRLPVIKQLIKGQCPQIRTALAVWPQVEGFDFLVPEERIDFFVKWGRIFKYIQSGKAFIGPKVWEPAEKARVEAEAAADAAAHAARRPTFLPPGVPMTPELAKALIPGPRPSPEEQARIDAEAAKAALAEPKPEPPQLPTRGRR